MTKDDDYLHKGAPTLVTDGGEEIRSQASFEDSVDVFLLGD